MFGFIFLDDISLGVPYIHFSGRLYVCSYVSWFACFHCWYSSHVWLLYLVVQMIILCDVCFGDGLVIYFNYFCLWNEMFILCRIKIYLLVRVRARWGVNRWMCQSMSAKWMDVSINECEMDVSIDEYVIIVVLVYFCGLGGGRRRRRRRWRQ